MARSDHADETDEPTSTATLWRDVEIDPVEIALPSGVGYTLRAYRLSSEVTLSEADPASGSGDDFDAASAEVFASRRRPGADDEAELEPFDEDELTKQALAAGGRKDDDDEDEPAAADDESDEDSDEAEEEEEEDEEEAGAEEVPVFLGRRGKVYLFKSPEGLVDFVKSGAEHDLSQLDSWSDLVERITVDDVEPSEEDRYELDLVVENLRGGHDVWDHTLIIKAGEIARDLGYALRIEPIVNALASGSPLDDLDESMRAANEGGAKAFFARRRLRKHGEQQAALGWRTIIGKISGAVDWRD
ncbi:DNA primase [Luedemannella helvata]|uniref:DNA primase n=1 Tax=Luedemannella helvata TaxID=349315 RepID=A0ABP4VW01_9ACTN